MTTPTVSPSLPRGNRTPEGVASGGRLLNAIWLGLVLVSVLVAAFTGRMEELQQQTLEGAKNAVQLVIGLLGAMAFFLGLMRVAREGGLLLSVSRALAPLMRRLFPDVPADHPAMSAMIMNLASNVLGLGNAATPFGLKAMVELEKLNARPGVASDATVLFIAINATVIHLFPLGTIAIRAGAGSTAPASIWIPTLLATFASCTTAVLAHFALRRLPRYRVDAFPALAASDARGGPAGPVSAVPEPEMPGPTGPLAPSPRARLLIRAFWLVLAVGLVVHVVEALGSSSGAEVTRDVLANWLLPVMIAFLLLVGVGGGVQVYDAAVEGAKESLEVATRILPFLVVILVAVAMFRASGALDLVIGVLDPITSRLGVPAEALPMALLRPLSGSGAFGVMSEIMKTHGADSFIGVLVSTYQGSTETTFYVLAVYLGAAGIRESRHALAACLLGDLAGFTVATAACHAFFR